MTGLGRRHRAATPASSTPRRSAPRRRNARSRCVGARQPESRRCPVVLDAFVAASFAGFIGAMLSADAVQRGRSLFAGREGDEVAEPAFVLADDGAIQDGPASAPFDGEGVADAAHAADRGRAGSTATSTTPARARKDGARPPRNAGRGSYRSPPSVGTTNLLVEPGDLTLEELVARPATGST